MDKAITPSMNISSFRTVRPMTIGRGFNQIISAYPSWKDLAKRRRTLLKGSPIHNLEIETLKSFSPYKRKTYDALLVSRVMDRDTTIPYTFLQTLPKEEKVEFLEGVPPATTAFPASSKKIRYFSKKRCRSSQKSPLMMSETDLIVAGSPANVTNKAYLSVDNHIATTRILKPVQVPETFLTLMGSRAPSPKNKESKTSLNSFKEANTDIKHHEIATSTPIPTSSSQEGKVVLLRLFSE